MTDHPKATLAYITEPQSGVYLLNLQFENGALLRVEISKAQLGGFVRDGASMAFRSSPNDVMKDWLKEKEKVVSS